jgi:DNA-binding PadR family transcriptional regulator
MVHVSAQSIEKIETNLIQHVALSLNDIVILRLLQQSPMNGYNIQRKVQSDWHITFPYGNVYSCLQVLEQKGFVNSESVLVSKKRHHLSGSTLTGLKRVKTYKVTPKGLKFLRVVEASSFLVFKFLQAVLKPSLTVNMQVREGKR